jgi:uncharacterized membrane protein
MAFCANCGAEVQGRFCAKCGTPLSAGGEESYAGSQAQQPPPGAQPYGSGSSQTPPGAQPYSSTQAGGLTENVAGALCYVLGLITGILFLVLAPYSQNKFVRFHAFQAIFFHLAWIVLWMVDMIIMAAMPDVFGIINALLWLVIAMGGLALWIFCIVKAFNHQRFKIPVIGDLAEKQA